MSLPDNPITRKEKYLAAIAGQAVEVPEFPLTREEAYLDEIAKNSGGGGTSDYNQLENLPQIGGNTLIGNKTASELGLADSDTVGGILNGTNIDSFEDVENALAEKQDKLTKGDYISIDADNNISVNRNIVPHQVSYAIKGISTYTFNITKFIDGVEVSSTDYGYSQGTTRTIDDVLIINDTYNYTDGYVWQFVWLRDSTTHDKDYTVSYRAYNAAFDFTEVFDDEDLSGYKLVIKSEMDAALAAKADIVDYSTTEQKTGQKWIDGRDIYRKVYDGIALANSTDVVVDANFGKSNDVIDFTCVTRISSASDKYQRPIQSFVAAGNDYTYPQVLNDTLTMVVHGNWTGEVATLIVDYVKAVENEE